MHWAGIFENTVRGLCYGDGKGIEHEFYIKVVQIERYGHDKPPFLGYISHKLYQIFSKKKTTLFGICDA